MILYLHGFRSGPQSQKVQELAARLAQRGLAGALWCEQLSPVPIEAVAQAEAAILAARAKGLTPTLFGSSLGGFYATYLAERHGLKALLINPAVNPQLRFEGYLGPQTNYYTGETWELTLDHVAALAELAVPPPGDPARFQVWLQTGDETLDYRQAQAFYRACALRIEPGGDHGFANFAAHLPALLAFAGVPAAEWRDIDFSTFA